MFDPSFIASTFALSNEQAGLFKVLNDRSERIARMYLGAVIAVNDGADPERLCKAAHEIRELMEKISEVANVEIRSLNLSALSSRLISMTSYCNSAPSYSYGIVVAIQYQVLDQNNPPAPIAPPSNALEPQEELLNVVEDGVNQGDLLANWRDIGPSSYPSATQFTDTNGQFWDAPYGACRQRTFTLTETQPISILLNGTRYPVGGGAVRTNNWSIQSTSSGHGSITNNSDVSQSQ
jgi:hypothetical protein